MPVTSPVPFRPCGERRWRESTIRVEFLRVSIHVPVVLTTIHKDESPTFVIRHGVVFTCGRSVLSRSRSDMDSLPRVRYWLVNRVRRSPTSSQKYRRHRQHETGPPRHSVMLNCEIHIHVVLSARTSEVRSSSWSMRWLLLDLTLATQFLVCLPIRLAAISQDRTCCGNPQGAAAA